MAIIENLLGLSEPAKVLIEKCSDAIGGIFKPSQIIRVAKAEAEAGKITAISKFETGEEIARLEQRALERFANEEMTKQSNMENIVRQAVPVLNQDAKPEQIEKDWLTNFFDKCRLISDKDMQSIWSKILAGEANAPGNFSKRTINFMDSLDKKDALLFTKLCDFNWKLTEGGFHPFIFGLQERIYKKSDYF